MIQNKLFRDCLAAISKWLTGRHNFTTQTIARIETALGSKLISIAH